MTEMILWEGTPSAVPAFRILAIIDGDIHAGQTRDLLGRIYQRFEGRYGKGGGEVSYNFPGHRGKIRKANLKLLEEGREFFLRDETEYGQGIRRYGYAIEEFGHPGVPFFGVEQRSYFHFLDIALPEDTASIVEFADFVTAELLNAPVITGVMGMGFFLPYHKDSLKFLLGGKVERYKAALEITPDMVYDGIRTEGSSYRWKTGELPGIADIGWRTLIGAGFWPRLPDIAQLRSGSDIAVEKSERVLCVTAGERPIWGDVEAGDNIDAYRSVASYLAPIRLPEGCLQAFGFGGGMMSGHEAKVHAYIHRFD
ncbi:Protein of unknown function [Rhizobium sp. NFR07]|uniref:DUF3396 domain-containing protein n=1 Tax=Rhizobium sp. NFR07 TaxID=1566262 RepID=UPI0008F1E4FB|nr:DUF3396 domain-containing protein [Rhizobium sp. NFR07]SFB50082.1 Protein of unknown function [Rhizobium sp. NFR07]